MKKILTPAVLCGVFLAALPASAQPSRPYRGTGSRNVVRIEGGLFTPRGDSAYWNDKRLEFSGDEEDFEDVSIGVDYQRLLSGRLALLASLNAFQGEADQSYLGFTDDFGLPITHTTTLEIDSFTLGLQFFLTRRDAVVVPYVGAGGGIFSWRLEESGDFIDFQRLELPIFSDTFVSEGDTFGWYYQAGVDIPITRTLTIFAEGRWQRADDELDSDFEGFGGLDLSGRDLRAGVSLKL